MSIRMKSLLNYFESKIILAKYFPKHLNLFIELFCFTCFDNSLKWCIIVQQYKSNYFVLHNFT